MTADENLPLECTKCYQSPATIETTQFHKFPLTWFGFFVTETWLYPEIEDSEVCPIKCNYSIIARQDRSGGEHGGVLVAAKKDFCFNYSDLTQKLAAI